MKMTDIVQACTASFTLLEQLNEEQRIDAINEIKLALHSVSPMKAEPVDCVLWVPNALVQANSYNPNHVAPPEMELLHHSISQDGYTQPIVTFNTGDGHHEVVDGFHRNRIGRESPEISTRVCGRLPVVAINLQRADKGDRIASTIRHNRARGVHQVDQMSDIILELTRRNWSDEKIAKELGMEADEVLRLKQITGLAELFADRDFSTAWESDLQ